MLSVSSACLPFLPFFLFFLLFFPALEAAIYWSPPSLGITLLSSLSDIIDDALDIINLNIK
jgi:hypothetical protein